jgi:hypothetical protein
MNAAELKERVAEMTREEQLKLLGWIQYLHIKDDPEYLAILESEMKAMDAGVKFTKADVLRLHEELIAKGR